MPSKKILAVAILAFSVVFSIWITRDKNDSKNLAVTPVNDRGMINSNNDWKNILVNVTDNDSSIISVVPPVEDIANDPSVTAKISKDFMSQYLLAIQDRGFITDEDVERITQNTLLDSENIAAQPKYTDTNLKIVNKNDRNTVVYYRDAVNTILKENSSKVTEDPVSISMRIMETENPEDISKIDFITITAQKLVRDLLLVEVPSSAVNNHLQVLNVFGSILSNLETMRESATDPVSALIGINAYQNLVKTQMMPALDSLNKYFIQKTGSAI